jgi:uncharacterized protein YoxC
MRAVLIALTVLEVAVLIGALAVYLILISRSLRSIAMSLGKVTFGVRAIETQTASIGGSLRAVNARLSDIADGLGDLTRLANERTETN